MYIKRQHSLVCVNLQCTRRLCTLNHIIYMFEIFWNVWNFLENWRFSNINCIAGFTVATLLLAFQETVEFYLQLPRWQGLKPLDQFLFFRQTIAHGNTNQWIYKLLTTIHDSTGGFQPSVSQSSAQPHGIPMPAKGDTSTSIRLSDWWIHLRINKK